MTLFRQFFWAHFRGMLIWIAVGALYALAGTRSASTFIGTDWRVTFSPSLLGVFGNLSQLSDVDAYLAIAIEKGITLIPVLYAVILALSVVTREVDKRTIDFLLSLPVQRTRVLLARVAALAVNITLVTASPWLVQRFDMAAQGYQASWGHLGLIYLNLWLLALAVGILTLGISMWIDDYSLGMKLFLGIVALAFVSEYALRGAGVSRLGRLLSPFSYVNVADIMRTGTVALGDVTALIAIVAAGMVVSFWAFGRKQFSV